MHEVTLISLFPRKIMHPMPHVHPSYYEIPAAPEGGIALLHLSVGKDFVYARDGKHVERDVPADELARCLIRDFCGSILGVSEDARPGMFYVERHINENFAKAQYAEKIAEERVFQMNWFGQLVRDADELWMRFHQHGMISDLHKDACNALKLEREWMIHTINVVGCPACGVRLMNPNVLRCPTCTTIIKPKEFSKLFGAESLAPAKVAEKV